MTMNRTEISRRWVLGALLAGAALPGRADAPASSVRPMPRPGAPAAPRTAAAPGAEALVAAAKLGGAVGYVVVDTVTGELRESGNADLGLPPASVAKAITSLYALERLGAGFRFNTRLIATGPVVGGRIEGDLVLAGSGDPTLSTDTLGDMAAGLRAHGVTGVSGRFLVWAGALPRLERIDTDQPVHVGYNPAISGLNLNFNRVHFEWKRGAEGYAVAMDGRGARFAPPVDMARMKIVERDLPVYTYSASGSTENWTVSRQALGREGSRWLPVRHPEIYAAEVFQTLARAQGITLPTAQMTAALPGGTVLVEKRSDELAEVLRSMLKHSTNLTAEAVGLTASGAGVESLAASGRRMAEWADGQLGAQGRFVDHSGLGAASRVSAQDMVTALVQARGGPLRGLLKDVGMRDDQGRKIKGHPVQVVGKTGTLNFVSGLAGYISTPGGRDLAYAIFCADMARRDALPMHEREKPKGGTEWARRARLLQAKLIDRWAGTHG